MIRLLTTSDTEEYYRHLSAVFRQKGLMSVKDKDWVNKILSPMVTYEKVHELLCEKHTDVWAEFYGEKIVKSIRAHRGKHFPVVTLVNYKSELTSPFAPVKDLLPLLDVVLSFYEKRGYYTFRLLRRLDLFTSSRLPYWEDNPPLNRYNSYYEEVIEPGKESDYALKLEEAVSSNALSVTTIS